MDCNSSAETEGKVSGTYNPPFFAKPCTIACAPVTFSPPRVLIKYIMNYLPFTLYICVLPFFYAQNGQSSDRHIVSLLTFVQYRIIIPTVKIGYFVFAAGKKVFFPAAE